MRILLLINMYPPLSEGGYPLECGEVMDELRERGHKVLVLTSTHGCGGTRNRADGVWRVFGYCPENKRNELPATNLTALVRWFRREWVEHGFVDLALREFDPDVIYVWATKGMSHSLAMALGRRKIPFVAHVSGYWLLDHNGAASDRRQFAFWRWKSRSAALRAFKRVTRWLLELRMPVEFAPLAFDRVAYTSKAIERDHSAMHASSVDAARIYPGVPVEHFSNGPRRISKDPEKCCSWDACIRPRIRLHSWPPAWLCRRNR